MTEALTVVDKTAERCDEAELYRLKGELLQYLKIKNAEYKISDTNGEAEAYFLKAIEIARRQSAKSLELRAVMSVARLWQQQGKPHIIAVP